MKIYVASRNTVNKMSRHLDVDHALISMKGSDEKRPFLMPNDKRIITQYFLFDDIDLFQLDKKTARTKLQKKIIADGLAILFDEKKADRIVSFVNSFKDKVEAFICQCYAGVSRSSAVAAAIAKEFEITDTDYFNHKLYYPNRFVYKLVTEAFDKAREETNR